MADKNPNCPDWVEPSSNLWKLLHPTPGMKITPLGTFPLLMVDMCPSVRRPHAHRSVTLECLPESVWEHRYPDSGPLRLALVLNSGDIVWRNTTHLTEVSLDRLPSDELLYKGGTHE